MKEEKKEIRPPGVPGPIPECYRHPRKSLDDFLMGDEARARIAEWRRQRREEAERIRQELGFAPERPWWENY